MRKRCIALGVIVLLFVGTMPLYADNLIQVYQQALVSDPTFKQARATWLAAQENLPLAVSGNGVAGNGLLPYVDLTAGLGRTYERIKVGSASTDGYFNQNNYQVAVTQQIFNYATWKSIDSARFSVKSATATYL